MLRFIRIELAVARFLFILIHEVWSFLNSPVSQGEKGQEVRLENACIKSFGITRVCPLLC